MRGRCNEVRDPYAGKLIGSRAFPYEHLLKDACCLHAGWPNARNDKRHIPNRRRAFHKLQKRLSALLSRQLYAMV